MSKQIFTDLLTGRDAPRSEPCQCDCHTPGLDISHCVPCCVFSGVKVKDRYNGLPQKETMDFVSRLLR